MGTRGLVKVFDEKRGRGKPKQIINLYKQFDCYPNGLGTELYEFLKPFTITNGIDSRAKMGYDANGACDLAAQLVCHFKKDVGGVYLYSIDDKQCGQDYEYEIYPSKDHGFRIKVVNRGCNFFGMQSSETNEAIFDGDLESFGKFCTENE